MSEHGHVEDWTATVTPHTAARWLLWAIIGTFALLILWAAFAQIDRVTHSSGRVIPSQQLQVVSNLEGGIVSAILVKAGQQVRAGAALLQLDATQSGADYGRGSVTLAALEARGARLEAEMSGSPPIWPVGGAPEQIANERALHASRMAEYAALMGAARARLSAAQGSLAEARIAADTRAMASASARQQADIIRPLVARGIEPRFSLVQADSGAAIAAGEAASARQMIARAAANVAEAVAAQAQAQADWRARTGEELAQVRTEREAQRKLLPAAADRMRRTTLTAPVSGTVNRVMASTLGGSVSPGQPLVEIVPARDTLVIEAMVRPEDIGFVAINQPAMVKITAYDFSLYGGIPGKVVRISPDAVVNEKDGSSHYLIRVAIDRDAIVNRNGERLAVGPGMVAEVDLLGDKRSILSYLLTPITRLKERAFRER
jgi:adhesin transport system membrane fusion protein